MPPALVCLEEREQQGSPAPRARDLGRWLFPPTLCLVSVCKSPFSAGTGRGHGSPKHPAAPSLAVRKLRLSNPYLRLWKSVHGCHAPELGSCGALLSRGTCRN